MLVNREELNVHFDGDEELIGDLLEVFESTYPDTLNAIKTSAGENDYSNLELHAHTLKGMIANFFAQELKEYAFSLEKMGREKTAEGAEEYIAKLEAGLPELVKEIRSFI